MSSSDNPFDDRDPRYVPRTFQPTTPAPENTGLTPRYVPPNQRTVFDEDPIVRPESSMSTASFETQFDVGGGVSLNDLMNGTTSASGNTSASQVENTSGTDIGGPAGPNVDSDMHGNTGGLTGYGLGAGLGALGTGAYGNNAGGQGQSAGVYGTVGNTNYGLGGMQQPPPIQPTYGNAALSVLGNSGLSPRTPRQVSGGSAPGAVRGGGTSRAYSLADLIKSGATDSPDAPDFGTPDGMGSRRKSGRQTFPLQPYTPSKRSTSDSLMIAANPINAGRSGNIKGNAAAFFDIENQPLPDWFSMTISGFKPTVEELFFVLPAIEPCRYAAPSSAGVVRIRNLPYTTMRSEITAFVGRNSQVINQPPGSPYYATHLIMERHTGKTMDAFIEFNSASEASWVVTQFQKRIMSGRLPKIGDRVVDVEISSQADLMSELFPRAKNVTWEGNSPRVMQKDEDYYAGVPATGFTGFLQDEEVNMIVKHAETPHRSAFVQRSVTRVYESWISTLHKYPWFAHETVNMTERRLVFEATLSLFRHLIFTLRRTDSQPDHTKPTNATLQELAVAALTCPGFSEKQKSNIVMTMIEGGFAAMTTGRGMNLKLGGNTQIAHVWPFQVLARAPGASNEMVNYFAALLHEANNGPAGEMSLADLHAMRASGGNDGGPFGRMQIDYGSAKTIADVGKVELRKVEELLKKVLPSARSKLTY